MRRVDRSPNVTAMGLKPRLPNVTNALVWTGVGLLVISLVVPGETAARAAKVETRAEEAARALLETAIASEPLDLSSPDAAPLLVEAFRATIERNYGHPDSYRPDPRERPAALANVECAVFESKHYCLMLTRRPTAAEATDRRPFEVYAWPRTLRPPGHTAFYVPEVGAPAFTRNKMHQYVGWEEDRRGKRLLPRPGAGRPRQEARDGAYRGNDDERWLLLRETAD